MKYIAILGNGLFILWILYNAIDEGFKNPGNVEAIALSTLVALLIFNSILLYRSK